MGSNSFGKIFCVTSFGESHGELIGATVDGCPSGVELSESLIDAVLAARKPDGGEGIFTARAEADKCRLVSGVSGGRTTGAPITILIPNTDVRKSDYSTLSGVFRPGHADFAYFHKYGDIPASGGGRASGRETAARIAAGVIAKQFLAPLKIEIIAHVVQIGNIKAEKFIPDEIMKNPLRCADPEAAALMMDFLKKIRTEKDSAGGIVELIIKNLPIGLGEPVFDKLDARLAYAIMGIGAVKGVEIGDGFKSAVSRGSENNDCMDETGFLSNHAGGILGGISTGEDVVLRAGVKPVPTIGIKQKSLNSSGEAIEFEGTGRHDTCVAPRVVPVMEAMAWLTLADMYLINGKIK